VDLIEEWNQTKAVKEMTPTQFSVLVKNTNSELEVYFQEFLSLKQN
jgi:hypothetical protein